MLSSSAKSWSFILPGALTPVVAFVTFASVAGNGDCPEVPTLEITVEFVASGKSSTIVISLVPDQGAPIDSIQWMRELTAQLEESKSLQFGGTDLLDEKRFEEVLVGWARTALGGKVHLWSLESDRPLILEYLDPKGTGNTTIEVAPT